MTDHPDATALAMLREGLLAPGEAAEVRAHLAGCPQCGQADAGLGLVTQLLAATPLPPIPADVATRIESALAAGPATRQHVPRQAGGTAQAAASSAAPSPPPAAPFPPGTGPATAAASPGAPAAAAPSPTGTGSPAGTGQPAGAAGTSPAGSAETSPTGTGQPAGAAGTSPAGSAGTSPAVASPAGSAPASRGPASRGPASRAPASRGRSGAAGRRRSGHPGSPGRGGTRSPRLLRAMAAAAVIVIAGGGGYALTQLTSHGGPSVASGGAASGTMASPPRAAMGANRAAAGQGVTLTTGTDYTKSRFASQVLTVLSLHPAGSGAHQPATGELVPPPGAPPGLAGCISGLTGGGTARLVDMARFQGHPAVIIVAAAGGATPRAWAVGRDCSATRPDVLATIRVPAGG